MGWLPYLLLWAGLLSGAILGALTFARFGPSALAAAVVAMLLLTIASIAADRGRLR